jgi:hypothetical protein
MGVFLLFIIIKNKKGGEIKNKNAKPIGTA